METIDHCFLHCRRTRGVWRHFHHTLSALTVQDFVPNVRNVVFYDCSKTFSKEHRLTRYVTQSILNGVWMFRNKATFHNGKENSSAIVKFIRNDMITRLNVDFSRLSLNDFQRVWCHPALCEVHEQEIFPKF